MAALYGAPLLPPEEPMHVYHLGHSLVGRDMPAMLAQLAGDGHGYESQLGWGSSLKVHWHPDEPIKGFEVANDHPRYRDARDAARSGAYDAFVATEMVEIRDAVRYHDSGRHLAKWCALFRDHNPGIRLFLYETWHQLDDPEGWTFRIERDYKRYWEGEILRRAAAAIEHPIYVIPAGQVLRQFGHAVAERREVEGLAGVSDLFEDQIHLNDLGAYLVAVTHFAVLYQRSPVGLPHTLLRADGTAAQAPGPESARLMQSTAWSVIRSFPHTGVN
jgi:hypothetical protein